MKSLTAAVSGLAMVAALTLSATDSVASSDTKLGAGDSGAAEEVHTVDFGHALSAETAFKLADAEDLEVHDVTLTIDAAIFVYQYDTDLTVSDNAGNVDSLVRSMVGSEAAVQQLGVVEPNDERSRSRSDFDDALRRLEERADRAPEMVPEKVDALKMREDLGDAGETAVDSPAAPRASTDKPETRAHANVTVFQTQDSVTPKDGGPSRREVTMEIQWINESDLRKAPDSWGYEVDLYQKNYNLSSTKSRPNCPAGTDKKFWADASLKGTIAAFIFNEGLTSKQNVAIEPHIDSNHILDNCDTGAIGAGIGEPKKIPHANSGEAGHKLHQRAFVRYQIPKGSEARSHLAAASSFVYNACPGKAGTNCMGLIGDPIVEWPDSLGGSTDMILLNESRKWRAPAHFSWDEYASKRPLAL